VETLHALASRVSDELEVLVDVKNDQVGELGGGRDEQVGDGWPTVLPTLREN